jgi:ferrochelatase
MIGGGSPILRWTQAQARGLEARLGPDVRAIPCMRYWRPDTTQALAEARAWAPDRLLLLPLYPQYSDATTGSSEREVRRQ